MAQKDILILTKEWAMKGPESFHETSIMTLTDVRVNLNVIMGLDV